MTNRKFAATPGVRVFVKGASQYCQHCGKISFKLFETTQENKAINQLKYCKQCYDENRSK